jgi:hypothetical protein
VEAPLAVFEAPRGRGPPPIRAGLRHDACLTAREYVYEVREDGRVLSTGRVRLEAPPNSGDLVWIAGAPCEVVEVIPYPGGARLLLRK